MAPADREAREDFNKFMVMETEGKGDPLLVDPVKSLWQYQKPVSIESPDSMYRSDSKSMHCVLYLGEL